MVMEIEGHLRPPVPADACKNLWKHQKKFVARCLQKSEICGVWWGSKYLIDVVWILPFRLAFCCRYRIGRCGECLNYVFSLCSKPTTAVRAVSTRGAVQICKQHLNIKL